MTFYLQKPTHTNAFSDPAEISSITYSISYYISDITSTLYKVIYELFNSKTVIKPDLNSNYSCFFTTQCSLTFIIFRFHRMMFYDGKTYTRTPLVWKTLVKMCFWCKTDLSQGFFAK